MTWITVAAAVLKHCKKILIAQRKDRGNNAGKWEFPGGKLEKNETIRQCLSRELHEELGICTKIEAFVAENKHVYHKNLPIHLIVYEAFWVSGTITLHSHQAIAWVKPETLLHYNFSDADMPIVHFLLKNF